MNPTSTVKRPMHRSAVLMRLVCGLLALLAGCTAAPPAPEKKPVPYRVEGRWYHPVTDAKGFRQRGDASWYGKKFHGKKTSSGEIYDMYAMTAAHKTLPLGTYVAVTNLDNQRRTTVRINDRGPFVRGRIIDLSYQAAREIDMLGPGTAPVEITALGVAPDSQNEPPTEFEPIDYYTGNFTFQVGAFKNQANARRLKQQLEKKYRNVHLTTYHLDGDVFYRVRVGRATSLEQAGEYEKILIRHGFKDVFIVAE